MRPTVSQYATALKELTEESSVSGATLAKNLFAWLKLRGEESKMPAIVAALEDLEKKQAEKLTVRIVTAHEVSQEVKKKLEEKAQTLFSGKHIELEHVIDTKVIGGVEFRTDETLYDATLRTELESLKKSLLKA